MKYLILILMTLLIIVPIISAEQNIKSVEYPLNYIVKAERNVDYLQKINLSVPEGIGKVLSFQVELYGDYVNTIISVIVSDGKKVLICSPEKWITPNSFGYKTIFDCTELINNQRNVEKNKGNNGDIISINSNSIKDIKPININKFTTQSVGFRVDKTSDNIYGNVKITYTTQSKASIKVHGTEYDRGQDTNAKVWLQLLNSSGIDYIDTAICQVHIYTPSNLQFVEGGVMTLLEEGIYYYDLSVPVMDGVYPVIAECFYDAVQNKEFADSNWGGVNSTYGSGTYTTTWVDDSSYLTYREKKISSTIRRLETGLNFTGITGLNPAVTLGITIYWNGVWNSITNDDVTMYIKNQTDNTWIALPNKIIAQSGQQTYSNTINAIGQNLTEMGYVSNGGEVHLRFVDTDIYDTSNNPFKTDYLYVSINEAGDGSWQEIKGSSELHVTGKNDYQVIINYGELTNETFDGYMYFYYIVASATYEDKEDVNIMLDLWSAFPCHEVEEVYVQNDSNDWNNVSFHGVLNSDNGERCQIHFDYNITNGTNYNVKIKSKNYWRVEMLGKLKTVTLDREIIYDGCVYYQQQKGLPNYSIPLTIQPNETDTFYLTCQYYLDAYDHFNYTLMNEFVLYPPESMNFTKMQMDSMEALYQHLLDIDVLLDDLMGGIINLWNQGNDYSQTIQGGGSSQPALLFFSNVSGNQLNYNSIINSNTTPQEIWEYYNRTLTDFDFEVNATANVNNTAIAESVWNWSGVINTNILNTIINAIWNYSSTISSNILTSISNDVWTHTPDRNLTYYNKTDVNNLTVQIGNIVNATTPVLFLGGTEYNSNSEGRIAVRLVISQGGDSTLETGAECNITIIRPNNSLQVNIDKMNEFGNGIYTYNFTTESEGVYTYYTDCNKENRTYYGMDTFHVGLVDEVNISNTVWERTDRNLTYYPSSSGGLTAEEVWEYSTRNLTFYEVANLTNVTVNINSSEIAGDVWRYSGEISDNILNQVAVRNLCYTKQLFEEDSEWGIDIPFC